MSAPNWLVKNLGDFSGGVTRRGGRHFLQLKEGFDEAAVLPAGGLGRDQVSLYVHIPFCRTLCPWCCFNRYPLDEDAASKYYVNLKREVLMYRERGFDFADVYFGGGTPTVMLDELVDFVNFLRQNFNIRQISMESTPREINLESVRCLQEIGVNRLSIGVQSFDEGVLKATGRASMSAAESREKLILAQGKFETLNLDLIFNFPSQTPDNFRRDVATFKSMGIDQVTFYPLMPSPHKMSALERRFRSVDTSRELEFYNIILSEVFDAGYQASTAWCFSRGDRLIDEYIIDYDDYVGVGAGSVSFVGGNFYVNSFALEHYDALVNGGSLPVVRWNRLSERETLRYYMLTKLFGMGLDPARFRARFGAAAGDKLRLELAFFKTFGLVKDDDRLKVTRRGMYPVSCMMKEFFAALNGLREYCIENQI